MSKLKKLNQKHDRELVRCGKCLGCGYLEYENGDFQPCEECVGSGDYYVTRHPIWMSRCGFITAKPTCKKCGEQLAVEAKGQE